MFAVAQPKNEIPFPHTALKGEQHTNPAVHRSSELPRGTMKQIGVGRAMRGGEGWELGDGQGASIEVQIARAYLANNSGELAPTIQFIFEGLGYSAVLEDIGYARFICNAENCTAQMQERSARRR